jgi:ferredoxin
MSKVRVIRQDILESEFHFKENDRTLLESLQKAGVDVLYHCKEGFCGACRCKIKSGNVRYINEPLAFVRTGEILTCCSQPESDIEIEVL